MAIKLKINGGWIYLTPTERKNIEGCIKLLENTKSKDERLHTGAFRKALGISKDATTHTLDLLKCAGIVKPQQYGRMRLYSLISGYRQRLKEKTCKIGEDKEKDTY